MPAKKTTKNSEGFSHSFSELEEITEWFEGDDVDLEKGLKKFERGLELAKQCKDMLKDVENHVEEIKKKFDLSDE
ncbi:MAG: exodeoxyribonuclease VII small subunit [bacterium]|nr:exodeoxyribonuclease VII small subunit [bacterium]